jgi:hypothetical protein
MDPNPAWDKKLDSYLVPETLPRTKLLVMILNHWWTFFSNSRSDITNIVNWSLNDDFSTAYQNISKLKIFKGLALQVERLTYSLSLVQNEYVTAVTVPEWFIPHPYRYPTFFNVPDPISLVLNYGSQKHGLKSFGKFIVLNLQCYYHQCL